MPKRKQASTGRRIIASARQALAFAEGKEGHGCVAHIPDDANVQHIRKKVHMRQKQFASYFGVSVRTVQEWEQGGCAPSGASRAFLTVIDREP